MGDFIKNNPFTAAVIFYLLLTTIFLFTVVKPYIDKNDNSVRIDLIQTMDVFDTLVKNDSIILETLKDLK